MTILDITERRKALADYVRKQIRSGAVEDGWIVYRDAVGKEVLRVKPETPVGSGDVIRIPPDFTFEC